jgi:hypothetical protein
MARERIGAANASGRLALAQQAPGRLLFIFCLKDHCHDM